MLFFLCVTGRHFFIQSKTFHLHRKQNDITLCQSNIFSFEFLRNRKQIIRNKHLNTRGNLSVHNILKCKINILFEMNTYISVKLFAFLYLLHNTYFSNRILFVATSFKYFYSIYFNFSPALKEILSFLIIFTTYPIRDLVFPYQISEIRKSLKKMSQPFERRPHVYERITEEIAEAAIREINLFFFFLNAESQKVACST